MRRCPTQSSAAVQALGVAFKTLGLPLNATEESLQQAGMSERTVADRIRQLRQQASCSAHPCLLLCAFEHLVAVQQCHCFAACKGDECVSNRVCQCTFVIAFPFL